jgi:hypothetical protein
LTFSINTPFPGEYALVPCVGAACLIYAGPQTMVGRMLSLRPVVFVGLISYSLYLWHWPLLIFVRYLVLRDLLLWEKAALILLSVAAAALSWAYVERPFRTRGRIPGKALVPLAGTAIGICVVASAAGEFSKGFPQRFDPAIHRLVEARARLPDTDQCKAPDHVRLSRQCRLGAQAMEPATLVLWGDSHAGSVSPAVVDIMTRDALSGHRAVRGGCAPLMGVTMLSGATGRNCRDFNDEIARIAAEANIRTVILSANWALYAEGTHFSVDDGGPSFLLQDDWSDQSDRRRNAAVFSRGLERTVAALARARKNIVIVGSVPELKYSVPYALARKHMFNLDIDIRVGLTDYFQRQINVFSELEKMNRRYGARIIYPHHALCTNGYCEVMRHGIPYYSDSNHLTEFGAKLLSPLFEEISLAGRQQ